MNRQLPQRIPTAGKARPDLTRSSECAQEQLAAVMRERFGDDTVIFSREPEPDANNAEAHG